MEAEFEFDNQPSEATQWAEEATEDDAEFAELDDEDLEDLEDYEDNAPVLDDDVIEP
jgi:hypothetical protein